MRRVAAVLLHYPVLDRDKRIVTTAITNLDLHDIARSARTFALERFYVVHPIAAQRELALRVREHWTTGSGARRIPDRKPAMSGLSVVTDLNEVLAEFAGDGAVELWTTSANDQHSSTSYRAARALLAQEGPPVLLVFGTGWGLATELYDRAAVRLEPIRGAGSDGYNHLSVRAAAAISFDRLFGESL